MVRGLLRLACFLLIAASPSFYVQAYLPPIGAKEFPRYSLQAHERDAPDELKPGRIPLFTRFKQSLVGLSFLVASSVPIFGSPSNVHAKKSAAAGTLVAKPSSKKDGKGKGGMVNAKATKKSKSSSVKVEVVVEDDQNAKLTKVGLALVAAAALYTILAPADSSSTSSSSKKSKSSSSVKPRLSSSSAPPRRPLEDFAAPKDDEEEDIFGDEDDNTANAIKKDVEPKSRRSFSSFKSPIPLPPPEDLFDSSDEFFSLPESRLESSVSSAAPQPASKALKPEPKAEVTTPTPAPVAKAPEKKGILDRIFGKAGGGRPTSVVDALAGASGEELEFRRKCVQALLRFAPPGSVADNLKLEIGPFSPEDDAAAIISAAREKAGLAPEAAAEGFAALASAMMVAIVDNVVALVEDKKASKEDREAAVVAALDETSTFIRATGELFGILFAGISVEPVVYNGRSKKGRLEDAYYIYAKTSMNVADILQQATSKSEDGAASENDIRMQNLGRVSGLRQKLMQSS